jgi:hemerythrin-like domain-containing protein
LSAERATIGENLTMPEALDSLRLEHCNLAILLRTLEWQVAEFQNGNQPDYDVIRATLDYFLGFSDVYHHPKEDLVFAKLSECDPGIVKKIGDLRKAHEELAVRVHEFDKALRAVIDEAEVSREAFARWARRFIDLQRQHIEMEESVFFPAAEKTLTAKDWADLKTRMTKAADPLFGNSVGQNFESLRKTILAWQAQDEKAADRHKDRQPVRP